MKKAFLLLGITGLLFNSAVYSQVRSVPAPGKKNISAVRPVVRAADEPSHFLVRKANPKVASVLSIIETQVGTTRYDLQTNQSNQNRIYRFSDGNISAVWTMGIAESAFADRGTGYNYYDGSAWGAIPTTRIESIRTGWPSVFPFGSDGEAVLSHDFATPGGLILMKRDAKGSGAWNQSSLPVFTGQVGPSWPRTVSSGPDHNTFHVIALTRPVVSGGNLYQGLDGAIVYTRSSDGGSTWDIPYTALPGMTSAEYSGFGGDSYAWAEPVDNNLAFVVGDNWTDLFLMKSLDNGATWSKTVIFQHPYPFFDELHTLVLDTPTVSDGSLSVSLDASGKAHVFSGLMRVLNSDTTDGTTSYFPYSDGLLYWNEDMPAFPTLNADTLYDQGHLVGYVQDMNGNDTIFEFDDVSIYFLSLTSMPTSSIDDDGNIFVAFTSVMENLSNGAQNYRHIWCRMSSDNGQTWTPFKDLTSSIIHNFHECVFPSLAPGSNDKLHLLYQYDDEPGLAVRGDEDPYSDNTIVYMAVSKSDLGLGVFNPGKPNLFVGQNFPNPFRNQTRFNVGLSSAQPVSLKVSTLLGQEMVTRQYGTMGQGNHTLLLSTGNLPAGLYLYTLTAGKESVTRTLVIE